MKRIFTLISALVITCSLFAQAPLKDLGGLNGNLVRPNMGQVKEAAAPNAAMLAKFNNAHPSTRGAQSYWLNSVSAIDSFTYYYYSATPGSGTDYLFSDSIVWIKYSNGNFHPFFYSLGDVFDPYAKMYKDYYSVHGNYTIKNSWPYHVDSMALLYNYHRYNTNTSVVDSLKITMMHDSGSNNVLFYKSLAVTKNNSSKDTVHVNNIPVIRYNNMTNRTFGKGAINYNVPLTLKDTGFIIKAWAVPMSNGFYVPAGFQLATSISFKTGLSFKAGDTLNTKLNALRVYSDNELGQDSFPVINNLKETGYNFSSTATKFNRYHLIHNQLDSLYLVAQIWTSPLNFNHHYIYYHITVTPTGINNITQTIKNISLYPNPSNNGAMLTFEANEAGRVHVYLYDITGRLVNTVADMNISSGIQTININTNNLTEGVYLVNIQDGSNAGITQKLIVKH